MLILFDQGTTVPLRKNLSEHDVQTAAERGWSALSNGQLLAAAESTFDLLITTDQSLSYQQNLKNRRLAILFLTTTSWPRIRDDADRIRQAANSITAGEYRELTIM